MGGNRVRKTVVDQYLDYVGESECPTTFLRWSALAAIGAYLGRRYSFQLGHSSVNPNIYVMIMGSPGTRKSTAIKTAASLLRKAGYDSIAADRTTKEKFLCDLAGEVSEYDQNPDDFLDRNLFGDQPQDDAEILIAADEFNIFIGNGNIEFLSLLGGLWDYEGVFEDKKKNSKSLKITNPTVSMLAGNTPTGFALAFPPEAIGQGIFSRLLLIHGEPTGVRITFPAPPSLDSTAAMIAALHEMRSIAVGRATLSEDAKLALDAIYKGGYKGPPDVRFESYSNRRFTHLLKLCLICSASSYRNTIEEEDVILANTILTHAEHTMPKALGEFGKARHSDVSHKIIALLESRTEVVTIKELWKQVHNDMEDIKQLRDLLGNLTIADKILSAGGGFLAKRRMIQETSSKYVDFSLLTEEERIFIA